MEKVRVLPRRYTIGALGKFHYLTLWLKGGLRWFFYGGRAWSGSNSSHAPGTLPTRGCVAATSLVDATVLAAHAAAWLYSPREHKRSMATVSLDGKLNIVISLDKATDDRATSLQRRVNGHGATEVSLVLAERDGHTRVDICIRVVNGTIVRPGNIRKSSRDRCRICRWYRCWRRCWWIRRCWL